GVIYLDSHGNILRTNTALAEMFQTAEANVHSLESLLGGEAFRVLQTLMRRSLRMGVVSREIELLVTGRVLHLAITVSSLAPLRANTGFFFVFDALTDVWRRKRPS